MIRKMVWKADLPPRKATAAPSHDIQIDIIVVGADLVGLVAARRLAENGPHQKTHVVSESF